jgi:hypothetical protein
VTLENLHARVAEGTIRELKIVLKADVQGFLILEPTDQVISLHQGGEFIPTGPVLGEVKIGL